MFPHTIGNCIENRYAYVRVEKGTDFDTRMGYDPTQPGYLLQ